MTTRFHNRTAAAIIALGSFAFPAFALDVSDVQVGFNRNAILGSEALPFYDKLSADLASSIQSMATMTGDKDAVEIDVSINKLSLDGTPISLDSTDFNELDGVVSFHSQYDDSAILSYPIRLAAYADTSRLIPEGFIAVAPTDNDYYVALIAAFAEATVKGLDDVATSTLQGGGDTEN